MPAAKGKLVAVQGPRAGSEYRLVSSAVKVGRDPQFNDFALNDQFVSNPHFSIIEEAGQFYIQDEGSTNRTRLNGVVIPPNQRLPLPPDSVIEAGQTRLQLKRLGGATRRLSGPPVDPSPRGQGSPPTQFASPPSPQQQATREEEGWKTEVSMPKRPRDQ